LKVVSDEPMSVLPTEGECPMILRNAFGTRENVISASDVEARHIAEIRRARMSMSSLGVLLFAVALAASAQVILKHGMTRSAASASEHETSLAQNALGNGWVWLGLALFGISALAWMFTLSRVPLNLAYPFNALGYLAILAASVLVLHERANVWTVLGSGMVVCGLVVVVTMSPSHG
jgi:drug/metabolite transporter (DMT)-like permease